MTALAAAPLPAPGQLPPPGKPRYVLEDRTLPHQIILYVATLPGHGNLIAVSCTCQPRPHNGKGRKFFDARAYFPAAEAIAAWRAWHTREVLA